MKNRFLHLTAIMSVAAGLSAQVASHAPTMQSASAPHATASEQEMDRPLVKVNGAVLSRRDLVREMQNLFPYARQHGGQFPKDSEPQIRQKAYENIVFEELVYQEALRRKMTVPPRN